MEITSLNIEHSITTGRARLINILDYDYKKISIIKNRKNKTHVYYDHLPFYLVIDNLKGFFEKYGDKYNVVGRTKNDQYLKIIFTSEYQKMMYTKILEQINKDLNKNYTKIKFESSDVLPLNILINIHTIDFVVRYQRIYINTCWYSEVNEEVQARDNVW